LLLLGGLFPNKLKLDYVFPNILLVDDCAAAYGAPPKVPY